GRRARGRAARRRAGDGLRGGQPRRAATWLVRRLPRRVAIRSAVDRDARPGPRVVGIRNEIVREAGLRLYLLEPAAHVGERGQRQPCVRSRVPVAVDGDVREVEAIPGEKRRPGKPGVEERENAARAVEAAPKLVLAPLVAPGEDPETCAADRGNDGRL